MNSYLKKVGVVLLFSLFVVLVLLSLKDLSRPILFSPDDTLVINATYGGQYNDVGRYLYRISNNRYLISGSSRSFSGAGGPNYDSYLVEVGFGSAPYFNDWINGQLNMDHGAGVIRDSRGYIVQVEKRGVGGANTQMFIHVIGNETIVVPLGPSVDDIWGNLIEDGDSYVVAGTTADTQGTGKDLFIYKYNYTSKTSWNNSVPIPFDDYGRDIIISRDGNYLVIGEVNNTNPANNPIRGPDFLIYKFNRSNGGIIKTASYTHGEVDGYGDKGYSIIKDNIEGYFIVGNSGTASDKEQGLLIKINESFNHKWRRFYGGTGYERLYDIQSTIDGGYIMVGETNSSGNGGLDAWLVKIDESGNVIWEKTYGGVGDDAAYSVVVEGEDDFVVLGETKSYGQGDSDYWLFRTKTENLPPVVNVAYVEPDPSNQSSPIMFFADISDDGSNKLAGEINMNVWVEYNGVNDTLGYNYLGENAGLFTNSNLFSSDIIGNNSYTIYAEDQEGAITTYDGTFEVLGINEYPVVHFSWVDPDPSNQSSPIMFFADISDDGSNKLAGEINMNVWVEYNGVNDTLGYNYLGENAGLFTNSNLFSSDIIGNNSYTIYAEDQEGAITTYDGTFEVLGGSSGNNLILTIPSVKHMSADSVNITWDSGLILSDSLVRYGLDQSHNNLSNLISDSNLVRNHYIELTGLNNNTKYYYNINSTDQSGNSAEKDGFNIDSVNGYFFVIDLVPPVVHNYSLAPDPVDKGDDVIVYVNTTDNVEIRGVFFNFVGQSQIQMVYYNESEALSSGFVSGSGFYSVLSTSGLSPGTNNYTILSTDYSFNKGLVNGWTRVDDNFLINDVGGDDAGSGPGGSPSLLKSGPGSSGDTEDTTGTTDGGFVPTESDGTGTGDVDGETELEKIDLTRVVSVEGLLSVGNSYVLLLVQDAQHTLTVGSASQENVVLSIDSRSYSINMNENVEIFLDGYNLKIKLVDFIEGKPKLVFTKISPIVNQFNLGYILLTLFVVIAIGLGVGHVMLKKKKIGSSVVKKSDVKEVKIVKENKKEKGKPWFEEDNLDEYI